MTGILQEKELPQIVANLEAWLHSMRVAPAGRTHEERQSFPGYGGPVVHWWQNCLSFTGPGLDWRYQGIISGYLTLWRRTGQKRWLTRARRAGDDLLAGQLPGGNFRASSFELNPYAGGTPHEGAADVALLCLAHTLRQQGDNTWRQYARAARRNLRCYYLQRLWDEEAQSFRDDPNTPSLVPNKACTLAEALFAWAGLEGNEEPIIRYALPTLETVLELQRRESGPLYGAIPQIVVRGRVAPKYFPYYMARCVPALLLAYDFTQEERWLGAAAAALDFIVRHVDHDGLLPQVLYGGDGYVGTNRFPQWIAPAGDVLHAAHLMESHGYSVDFSGLHQRLVQGQLPGGGFRTAHGFAAQVSQSNTGCELPDFRDLIAVAGWNDKAFRYLAEKLSPDSLLPAARRAPAELPCLLRGRDARWIETGEEMVLFRDGKAVYRWCKGQRWAAVVSPEVMWR